MEVRGRHHTPATLVPKNEVLEPIEKVAQWDLSRSIFEKKNLLLLLGIKPQIIQPVALSVSQAIIL